MNASQARRSVVALALALAAALPARAAESPRYRERSVTVVSHGNVSDFYRPLPEELSPRGLQALIDQLQGYGAGAERQDLRAHVMEKLEELNVHLTAIDQLIQEYQAAPTPKAKPPTPPATKLAPQAFATEAERLRVEDQALAKKVKAELDAMPADERAQILEIGRALHPNLPEGLSDRETVGHLLRSQLHKGIGEFLGRSPETVHAFLVSGEWGEKGSGETLRNRYGIDIPRDVIVDSYVHLTREGLPPDKIFDTLSADLALHNFSLRAYIEGFRWLAPESRPHKEDLALDKPDLNGAWTFGGRPFTGAEMVELYADAARITPQEAIEELHAHAPRPEVLAVIQATAEIPTDEVADLHTAYAFSFDEPFHGKSAEAVFDAYDAHGLDLNRVVQDYGSPFPVDAAAARAAAKKLGIADVKEQVELITYLKSSKWMRKPPDGPMTPRNVFRKDGRPATVAEILAATPVSDGRVGLQMTSPSAPQISDADLMELARTSSSPEVTRRIATALARAQAEEREATDLREKLSGHLVLRDAHRDAYAARELWDAHVAYLKTATPQQRAAYEATVGGGTIPLRESLLTAADPRITEEIHEQLTKLIVEEKQEAATVQAQERGPAHAPAPEGTPLAKLEQMPGLLEAAGDLRGIANLAKLGTGQRRLPLHRLLVGNDGLDLPLASELYGQEIVSGKYLGKGKVVTVDASDLLGNAPGQAQTNTKAKIEEAKNGVLVVNDLDSLDFSTFGVRGEGEILGELKKALKRDDIAVIASVRPVTAELLAKNDRAFATLKTVRCPDLTDEEIARSIDQTVAEFGRKIEPDTRRRLVWRVSRQRNGPGFDNNRAVLAAIGEAVTRHAQRLEGDKTGERTLTSDDFNLNVNQRSEAYATLKGMVGLKPVKEWFQVLDDTVAENLEIEKSGKKPEFPSLHLMLTGNPGTGKTTVAELYGKFLREKGLLSNGEVIVVKPAELIGGAEGQTEQLIAALLERAKGKVLFIDEAYELHEPGMGGKGYGGYGGKVIDALVAATNEKGGQDFALVMAGYKDEMEAMRSNTNPGLPRRMANVLHLDDYSNDELKTLFENKAAKSGYTVKPEVVQAAVSQLALERALPNFGNASAVETIVNQGISSHKSRIAGQRGQRDADNKHELTYDDLMHGRLVPNPAVADRELAELVGQDAIKEQLTEYKALLADAKARGLTADQVRKYFQPYFLFKGPPGAGKTHLAQKMGDVFFHYGFLPSNEVVVVDAKELVAGFVGQTHGTVEALFKKARGKTLFIDEAYQLAEPDLFSREAINRMLSLLTANQGRMAVILAGYSDGIDQLMAVNPGLPSRFNRTINVSEISPAQGREKFEQLVKSEQGLSLSTEATEALEGLVAELKATPGFSNYRDIETVFVRAQIHRAKRQTGGREISKGDLSAAVQELIQERSAAAARPVNPLARAIANLPVATADATRPAPTHARTVEKAPAKADERKKRTAAARTPPKVRREGGDGEIDNWLHAMEHVIGKDEELLASTQEAASRGQLDASFVERVAAEMKEHGWPVPANFGAKLTGAVAGVRERLEARKAMVQEAGVKAEAAKAEAIRLERERAEAERRAQEEARARAEAQARAEKARTEAARQKALAEAARRAQLERDAQEKQVQLEAQQRAAEAEAQRLAEEAEKLRNSRVCLACGRSDCDYQPVQQTFVERGGQLVKLGETRLPGRGW